jgi:hypothetical protein
LIIGVATGHATVAGHSAQNTQAVARAMGSASATGLWTSIGSMVASAHGGASVFGYPNPELEVWQAATVVVSWATQGVVGAEITNQAELVATVEPQATIVASVVPQGVVSVGFSL